MQGTLTSVHFRLLCWKFVLFKYSWQLVHRVKMKMYRNLQLERTIIFILNSSVAWQALHHVSSYAKWVSVQKFWKLFGFRFKSHEKDDKGKKVEFSCLSFIVVLHYYLLWCPCRPILGFSIDQESSFDWITQSFIKPQFQWCGES